MKKITSLLVALMMLATFVVVPVSANAAGFDGTPATGFSQGGSGTETDPYLISDAAELAYAATKINDGTDNTKYFKLTADIDYNGQEWVPMGNSTNYFKGNFDGQGHVVKNIKITANCAYIGFFGLVANGGVVKNLGIDNMNLKIANEGSRPYAVGGFAAYVEGSTITDCYLKNSGVTCNSFQTLNGIGIFAGVVRTNSMIKNCYAYGIETLAQAGDINAGFAHKRETGSSTFENCYVAESKSTYDRQRYSFGSKDSLGDVTVTNCWSTFAAKTGTSYNTYSAFGDYTADKDTLVSKFDGVNGFAVTREVNDGYPCLAWEIPADNPLYAAGRGTEERPYEIATAEQLKNASEQINAGVDNKAYFKLTADIDYKGQEWTPIGTSDKYFQGKFDGQGHTVKNIAITVATADDPVPSNSLGFFGYVGNADGTEIKDLGIEGIKISFLGKGVQYAGGFAGYVHAYTKITNCYVKDSYVCYETGYLSQIYALGGFVGYIRNLYQATTLTTAPVVENCYVYNTTLRTARDTTLAGFAGAMGSESTACAKFKNCYVAGITYPDDYKHATVDSGVGSTVYGFANKGSKTVDVDNCYSSLAGGQGAYGEYTAENSLGIVGATQSAIVDAFKNVEGFAVSPAVNGGYPCFADEVPFKVTSVDSSNGTVKIARKAGVTTPATVYVATYDADDRLVDVATATVNDDDFTFTPVGLVSGAKIKAFVWGANNNPLTYVD